MDDGQKTRIVLLAMGGILVVGGALIWSNARKPESESTPALTRQTQSPGSQGDAQGIGGFISKFFPGQQSPPTQPNYGIQPKGAALPSGTAPRGQLVPGTNLPLNGVSGRGSTATNGNQIANNGTPETIVGGPLSVAQQGLSKGNDNVASQSGQVGFTDTETNSGPTGNSGSPVTAKSGQVGFSSNETPPGPSGSSNRPVATKSGQVGFSGNETRSGTSSGPVAHRSGQVGFSGSAAPINPTTSSSSTNQQPSTTSRSTMTQQPNATSSSQTPSQRTTTSTNQNRMSTTSGTASSQSTATSTSPGSTDSSFPTTGSTSTGSRFGKTLPATTRVSAQTDARSGAGRLDPFLPITGFRPFPTPTQETPSAGMDLPPPPPSSANLPSVANQFPGQSRAVRGLVPPPPPTMDINPTMGGDIGVPVTQLPMPPTKPTIADKLRVIGIIGNRAILTVATPGLKIAQKWPKTITLGPGEQFESISVVDVTQDSVTIEEDGERSVMSVEPVK